MKRTTVFYWVLSGLLFPALGIGSVMGILQDPDSAKVITGLGYPAYLDPFLGVARLLGLCAIVLPGFPRLKEWAYAGLAFDILGAIFSILAAGNPVVHVIFPAIVFGVLMGSYVLHHKLMEGGF